jgi:transketolase
MANGIMVSMALIAADKLVVEGIDAGVVDVHTVKPLDEASVDRAATETGAIVVAEEHSVIGGLGSAVAEFLAESRPTPVVRVGIRDRFGDSSRSYEDLLRKYGLTPDDIVEAVRASMGLRDRER